MPTRTPIFDLRVTFRGLCLFVPDDKDKRTFTVLLPDARPESKHPPATQECSRHFPILFFGIKNISRQRFDPSVRDSQGHHFLEGVDVDFPGLPGSSGLSVVSLDMVPNIDDICTEVHGGVDKSIVEDPRGKFLAARFRIDRGELRGQEPFLFNGEPVEVQFSPIADDSKGYYASMASNVTLEVKKIALERIELRIRPFGRVPRSIYLYPTKSGGKWDPIELQVVNICGDGIFLRGSTFELPDKDPDFMWHYMLTIRRAALEPRRPGNKPVPIPLPVPANYSMDPTGGGGGVPVRCGPAQSNVAQEPPAKGEKRKEERDDD